MSDRGRPSEEADDAGTTRPGSAVATFAFTLRRLRDDAGRPTYRQMARRAHCSAATLCRAAAGDRLPSLDMVLGFVDACGGDRREWAARWRSAAAAQSAGRVTSAGGDRASAHGAKPISSLPGGRFQLTPAQLPLATAGFVGRAAELAALYRLLPGGGHGESANPSGATAIAAISGMAGAGKTTLAVQFSHQVAERFPDGHLYLDLRGFDPDPALSTGEALGRLLRSLGADLQAIPAEVDEKTLVYRSMTADRRMLILLDNVASVEQIRSLLPGSPACLVLVTSRRRLAALAARYGASQIMVGVLSEDESLSLLSAVAGAERIQAEWPAARELARLTGYLPLALRIAAASLAAYPDGTVGSLVAELAENRLGRLAIDEGPAIEPALDLSYRHLAGPAARLFRYLGLIPGPHFTVAAAAAVAGLADREAAGLLAVLGSTHLVQSSSPERCQFHELVRLFARDRYAAVESAHHRSEATARLLTYYLRWADAATRRLYPRALRLQDTRLRPGDAARIFDDDATALAWLEGERPNLVAAIDLAGDEPQFSTTIWQLADALQMFFQYRRYADDYSTISEAGLAAALREDDSRAEAAMRKNIGYGYQFGGHYPQAAEEYARALVPSRRSGWRACEASILSGLAFTAEELGTPAEAIEHYRQALQLQLDLGDNYEAARILSQLGGGLLWKLGRLEEADDCLRRALRACEDPELRLIRAHTLTNLGNVVHEMGRLDEALELLSEALSIHRELGHRNGEAIDLCDLGGVHRDLEKYDRAHELGLNALELAREMRDSRVEAECLNTLADYHLRTDAPRLAADCAGMALGLALDSGYRYGRARATIRLARAALHARDFQGAARECASALTLTRTAGYRMLEGIALSISARIALASGRIAEAVSLGEQAATILRETGHRPGETDASRLLAEARRIASQPQ